MTKFKKSGNRLSKKKIVFLALLILSFLFFVFLAGNLYVNNNTIRIRRYTVASEKINTPVKLVQISDLHTKSLQLNNKLLLDKVKKEAPDLILLTGDIVDKNHSTEVQVEYIETLIKQLVEISPVYYSPGNHERTSENPEALYKAAQNCGATVLEYEYKDLEIKGNKIRLGGLSYYNIYYKPSIDFAKDFEMTDSYKLALLHFPELYAEGLLNYEIDLTLSGHTHGGMVRIPAVGGLISPGQGLFPKYDKGYFTFEKGDLIISAGLASSPPFITRILNPPEISVIELK